MKADNKDPIGKMEFFGEEHYIYMKKVGKKYGLFVINNGVEEMLEDTKLENTKEKAISEASWTYGNYNIEWYE